MNRHAVQAHEQSAGVGIAGFVDLEVPHDRLLLAIGQLVESGDLLIRTELTGNSNGAHYELGDETKCQDYSKEDEQEFEEHHLAEGVRATYNLQDKSHRMGSRVKMGVRA